MKSLLVVLICVGGVTASMAQTAPRVISAEEQAEMAAKERILMRMRISEIEERDRAGTLRPPRRGFATAEQESNALRAKMIVLERTDSERPGGPLIPPAPKSAPSSSATPPASSVAATEAEAVTETPVPSVDAEPVVVSAPPAETPVLAAQQPAPKKSKTRTVSPTKTGPSKPAAAPAQPVLTPVGRAESNPLKANYEFKRQKLADLLELYMADRISPAEYHRERAKIVLEP
ncbi:MAG: hypothetical protein AB1705_05165 [Verrucomicrobiota bacterium]